MAALPLDHQVDATPIGVVYGVKRGVLGKFPRRCGWEWVRLTGGDVEIAGRREQAVTDFLRREPSAREPHQQAIFRILVDPYGVGCITALVSSGLHDQAMDWFDVVSTVAQLCCEPINQFRVCRWFTTRAKIVRRRDQSPSEMPLPDAIYYDASE